MILESIALQDRGYQPGDHLEDGASVNLGERDSVEPEDVVHGPVSYYCVYSRCVRV